MVIAEEDGEAGSGNECKDAAASPSSVPVSTNSPSSDFHSDNDDDDGGTKDKDAQMNWKRFSGDYFAWSVCACALGGGHLFVDLVPPPVACKDDGAGAMRMVVEEVSETDFSLMGRSLERVVQGFVEGVQTSRVSITHKTLPAHIYSIIDAAIRAEYEKCGSLYMKHCSHDAGSVHDATHLFGRGDDGMSDGRNLDSPRTEMMHRLRDVTSSSMYNSNGRAYFAYPSSNDSMYASSMRMRADSPVFNDISEAVKPMPHVLLVQNIDQASPELLAALSDLMRTRSIPARAKHGFNASASASRLIDGIGVVGGGVAFEANAVLPLPEPFVVVCTSTRIPFRASPMALNQNDKMPSLHARFLDLFMMRIPVGMPSRADGSLELMRNVASAEHHASTLREEISALEAANKVSGFGVRMYESDSESGQSDPDALLDADHLRLVQRAAVAHAACSVHLKSFVSAWPKFYGEPCTPTPLRLADFSALSTSVQRMHTAASLRIYIRNIVSAIRRHPLVGQGGPDGDTADILAHCARAVAAMSNQAFVAPHNIFEVAVEVTAHRFACAPRSGDCHPLALARSVVGAVVCETPVPR